MTAVAPHSVIVRPFPPVHRPRGSRFLGYLSTTDPKVLGVLYKRPAFELHHPQMTDRLRTEAHPHGGWLPLQATESSLHLAKGAALKDPAGAST